MTDQDRRTNNLQILNELTSIVEKYPDLRFGQIINTFINNDSDIFYEEPDLTLKRIKERIKMYL